MDRIHKDFLTLLVLYTFGRTSDGRSVWTTSAPKRAAIAAQPGRRKRLAHRRGARGLRQPNKSAASNYRCTLFAATADLPIEQNRMSAQEHALRRVTRAFDLVERVVPKRIASEEIGDALEAIARHMNQGAKGVWWVYLKMAATIFWLLVHTIHQLAWSARRARR